MHKRIGMCASNLYDLRTEDQKLTKHRLEN